MKKATQPRNKTRRKKAPLWKVSLRKGRVPFVLLLITLGLIWLKSQNVLDKGMTLVHNSIVNLSEKAGFIIEGILIEGRNKTEKEQIYTALNRKKGDSILLCDPSEIKDNLERLPWVRSAMVQRRLPDTLYIRLSERKPLALWQSKKKLSLLDDRGLTMDTIPVSPFRHLPIIIGEGSAEKAPKFLEVVLKVPFMK
ncbi:MAG: FtsQ-type POTRA domain-containing protein, partial [Alphaproteobacteria bacterium]|nr:FtsQ-type POTRA domain-containing protein [Alphaproteobacteria bacterium]